MSKRFPIQDCGTVPWGAAERAYRGYVAAGHGDQSLIRLAERGGFGAGEFAVLYQMLPYNDARFERIWVPALIKTARELGDDWQLPASLLRRIEDRGWQAR